MSLTSEARINSEMAGRYMRQLCSHFAHKIPASYTDDSGRIEFEMGLCTLAVEGDQLVMRAHAEDAEKLKAVEDVVGRHVERFAWREAPQVTWSRAA